MASIGSEHLISCPSQINTTERAYGPNDIQQLNDDEKKSTYRRRRVCCSQ
jgi:hypothetical protein